MAKRKLIVEINGTYFIVDEEAGTYEPARMVKTFEEEISILSRMTHHNKPETEWLKIVNIEEE